MSDSNEPLGKGQIGDGNGGQPGTQEPELAGGENAAIDGENMTKEQLLTLAKEIGVKAKAAMSKEEIIKAIEDFQAAQEVNRKPPSEGQEGNGSGTDPAKSGEDEEKPQGVPQKAILPTGDPIGTIKTINGAEYVNVGTAWVPAIRDNITSDKPVVVVSKKRAGKTIYATTGKAITFDENGRATVSAEDARYLTSIVIDEVPQYTAEGND
jgi:hypothetical protein